MITTILIHALTFLLGFFLGRIGHKREQIKKGKVCKSSRSRWIIDFTPIDRLLESRRKKDKEYIPTEVDYAEPLRRPLTARSKRMGKKASYNSIVSTNLRPDSLSKTGELLKLPSDKKKGNFLGR